MMGLQSLFKKDTIVGLDIGSSSVKVAQFIKKEGGDELVHVYLEEVAFSGDGAPSEEKTLTALREALKKIDIRRSRFAVCVNCPKTAVRRVRVSVIPRSELKNGIRLHAAHYFPFPIEDAMLDFEVLGEVDEKGSRKYELLVATVPRKTVENQMRLLSKLGIRPAALIPAPLALQKVMMARGADPKSVTAALDIGGNLAELVILSGRELVFSRKIPVAGKDITESMTVSLASASGNVKLSWEEAERLKRQVGIPPDGENRIIEDKISTVQLLSMVRAPVEQLAGEIERCFDYYREETGGEPVGLLELFGGGASLKGLAAALSLHLGIEVRPGETQPRLALAIGAALCDTKAINLLPVEVKEEGKRAIRRVSYETIIASGILLLAFIYIGLRIQLSNFDKRISVSKAELSSLQTEFAEARDHYLAASLLKDEPYWEDVFREVSNVVPKNVYLTRWSFADRAFYLRGVIVSKDKQSSLSDFILTLERGLFAHVTLVTAKEMEEEGSSEFELKCQVEPNG